MNIKGLFERLFGKKEPEKLKKRPAEICDVRHCPFCGKPVFIFPAQTDDGIILSFICTECRGNFFPPPDTQGNIKKIIAWWNNRVTDLNLSQEMKDLLNG